MRLLIAFLFVFTFLNASILLADDKAQVDKYGKTFENMKTNCEKGESQACADLARAYFNEKKDGKNALKYAEIACKNNNPRGCTDLAGMYMLGVEVKQDNKKAIELSTKFCDDGFIDACSNLSFIYVSSPPESFGTKDYSKGKFYSEKACSGGNPYSCGNLAKLYENGYGVIMNYDKSLSLYKKACAGGNASACNKFKLLYDKVCLTNPKKYCSKYE